MPRMFRAAPFLLLIAIGCGARFGADPADGGPDASYTQPFSPAGWRCTFEWSCDAGSGPLASAYTLTVCTDRSDHSPQAWLTDSCYGMNCFMNKSLIPPSCGGVGKCDAGPCVQMNQNDSATGCSGMGFCQ